MAESKKIKQQAQMISEFGYGSLNTRDKLVAKKGLVFAYWEGSRPVSYTHLTLPTKLEV